MLQLSLPLLNFYGAAMIFHVPSLLAQQQNSSPPLIFALIELAIAIVVIIGMWKVFEKAGKPGWGAIIPIYNLYLLAKIAGKSGWWVLLCCIPFAGVIFAILITVGVGQAFGKGGGFIVGMIFLPFIFFPILGFGDSQYQPFANTTGGFPVVPR